MTCARTREKRFRAVWRTLLVVVLIVTVWAGVDPKDYRFRNPVSWIEGGPGLHFDRYGLAFTEPFLHQREINRLAANGWTLELALRLTELPGDGFKIIAAFHSGDDDTQLILGQWRSHLIVMNGDDYSHRRRLPRVTVDTAGLGPGALWVTIRAGRDGTTLDLQDQRRVTVDGLVLQLPGGAVPGRLILGNGARGTSSMKGDLLGLALYDRVLEDGQIADHYQRWQTAQGVAFTPAEGCLLLYPLEEGQGERALDRSGRDVHLWIPPVWVVLQRTVLASPWPGDKFDGNGLGDVALNLFGLMPLGFLLMGILAGARVGERRTALLFTLAAGLLLSLGLEWYQSYVPSRSSSFLDWVLNGLGVFVGALVFGMINRRRRVMGRPLP